MVLRLGDCSIPLLHHPYISPYASKNASMHTQLHLYQSPASLLVQSVQGFAGVVVQLAAARTHQRLVGTLRRPAVLLHVPTNTNIKVTNVTLPWFADEIVDNVGQKIRTHSKALCGTPSRPYRKHERTHESGKRDIAMVCGWK